MYIKTDHKTYRIPKEATASEILEIAESIHFERLKKEGPIHSAEECYAFLKHRLATQDREHFVVVFLDAQNHMLGTETMFMGTLNGARVYAREVVKRALENNAYAVILAHNHPSGNSEPSEKDVSLTKSLQEALKLVEVELLDHLVIGHGEFTSMSDKGLF